MLHANLFSRTSYVVIFFCILLSVSCSYDKSEVVRINDGSLFDLTKTLSGFQYYKKNADTLVSNSGSPHGSYVRIRFNSTATAAMNSDLSTLNADRFPDGSIVVKEIYDSPGAALKLYATMFKTSVDGNGSGGWLWAEFGPSGNVIYSVDKKGVDCTSCHSTPDHKDFIRTFALH